jgi:glycosyltransferase involved in cell wall biosynthesis
MRLELEALLLFTLKSIKMAQIVHFGKYYFPDSGGIESVTLSLAKGAAAAGYTVTVVCFKKSDASDTEFINGVRIIRTPIWKLFASQPLSWKYFVGCLRESLRADIVHLHAPNMVASLCAIFVPKRIKLIVHWHSDVIGKGLLVHLFSPLVFILLKRADLIIATSQVYAKSSAPLRRFYSKLTVVPIGVQDPKKLHSGRNNLLDLPPDLVKKADGKKIILSIGRLVPYKGFNILVEAARYLAEDAVVFIVGVGPLNQILEASIEDAKLSDRVYLIGQQSNEALMLLYESATLFCLPSIMRSEAFGVVLLEAMAYGLPVVATDIPGSGVPWVNMNDVSGINVAVGDPLALANACNLIIKSPSLRLRYSIGARERFLSSFTEAASVNRILEIYNSLI